MNRIYQGKVTQVEIPDSAEKGKWLLFHRDSDRTRELTGRIPELRQQVEAEITARAGWSVEEQQRRPKSVELSEYEKLRAEQRQQWQDALWQHHQVFSGRTENLNLARPEPGRYFVRTSLLSVSTAGRGAASSEAAPAFFPEATTNVETVA